jgi:hypothetical protein
MQVLYIMHAIFILLRYSEVNTYIDDELPKAYLGP